MDTNGAPGPVIPEWTIADRLRKAREHAQLEQRELAADLGISRNTVNNYEHARHSPRRPVVLAWGIRCGVDVGWLWTGEAGHGDVAPPGAPWHAPGGVSW